MSSRAQTLHLTLSYFFTFSILRLSRPLPLLLMTAPLSYRLSSVPRTMVGA